MKPVKRPPTIPKTQEGREQAADLIRTGVVKPEVPK